MHALVPTYALIGRAFAHSFSAVPAILHLGARANILTRIIKTIAITVIVFLGRLKIWKRSFGHNAVHVITPLFVHRTSNTHGVIFYAVCGPPLGSIPTKLLKKLIVFRRDKGELGLCKMNEASNVAHSVSFGRAGGFADNRLAF